MVLVTDTINAALRKLGRLAAGREPRPTDQRDALSAMRGLYSSWIAGGAFGRIHDVVPIGTDYTAQGNVRVYRTAEAALNVTLPSLVSDDWVRDYGRERVGYYGTLVTITENGNQTIVDVSVGQPMGCVTPPRDGQVVIISDEFTGKTLQFLYDGTGKRWQQVSDLQLTDEAPRSSADPEGLAACLAVEIADQFGAEVQQSTLRAASRFQQAMTHRYGFKRQMAYDPGAFF